MSRRCLPSLLFLFLALLALPARAQDDPPPPEKPKATAADLEKKLATAKVTVDWKDTAVLDAVNDLQQKSGVKFFFDAALADFIGKRKVTFDGYAVSAREALGACQKAGGFEVAPDAAAGGFQLKQDPAYPTRVALEEKKVSVKWQETPVERALAELQKKTGLKLSIHETMKKRLSGRRVTWEANDVTAKDAIEALYTMAPGVDARLDAGKGGAIQIVYAGATETHADLEFALDDRRLSPGLADAGLDAVVKLFADALRAKVEVDPKLAKEGKKVTYAAKDVTPRAALDAIAKAAGVTWKAEGAKVVLRPAASPK